MSKNKLSMKNFGALLVKNNVTVLFIVLCVACFFTSTYTLPSLFAELFVRFSRNTFLILSLLIPVIVGIGLNFGIVLGAMAMQIAIFLVVHWGFTDFTGIMMCVLIATPLAALFGYLIGSLFNKMKGAEMIGGLIAGFFADGLYQLLFLNIFGGVIKIDNKTLMISTGRGVKNVINLKSNMLYAIDNVPMLAILDVVFYATIAVSVLLVLYRLIKKRDLGMKKILRVFVPVVALYALSFIPSVYAFMSTPRLLLLNAVEFGALGVALYHGYKIISLRMKEKSKQLPMKHVCFILVAAVVYALTYVPILFASLSAVQLPVLTYILIGGLCLFTRWFLNTKLGQDMRTVGQDKEVATSSGINVDRTRIIAMIMSTVLASYGQLISLQNIGTVATYGAHQQVGLYAIAALLVGGASVRHATVKHAILGVILFHTLFILSSNTGQQLFGNAQIGEYFRVFVAYGVIAVALAMHAWQLLGGKDRMKELKAS